MFGPLFGFELIRLLRRRAFHLQRGAYVLALFLALLLIYNDSFGLIPSSHNPITRNQLAQFGESFLNAFIVVQFIAILLLVPVYLGGAIVEERVRKSWDFLISSPLPTHQIVFGKLFARMIVVFMILAAGLPVLLIASFIGGIDPQRVLYAFALHAGLVYALGTFSFLLSNDAQSLLEILLKTFGIMLAITLFGSCCGCMGSDIGTMFSPISAQIMLLGDPSNFVEGQIWAHLIFCFTVGTLLLLIILNGIRQAIIRYGAPKSILNEIIVEEPSSVEVPRTHRDFFVPMLFESEDPLLWKERHFNSRYSLKTSTWLWTIWIFVTLAVFGIFLIGILASVLFLGQSGILSTLRIYMLAGVTLFPLRLGMRTASSFGIERQRGTLESLFMLPGDRVEILNAKWHAAVASIEIWLKVFFISAFLFCWLCPPIFVLLVILTLAVCAAFLWFAGNLGLWVAVRTRNTTQASVVFLVLLLFCWIMPLISPQYLIYFVMDFCLDVERKRADPEGQFGIMLWQILLCGFYLIISRVCWRNAVSRLNQE